MNQTIKVIVLSSVMGAFVGGMIVFLTQNTSRSEAELIKEFYEVETAVHVSPHHLRKAMTKGEMDDYVLIDLRSPEEYEKEHVVTAMNVPAYKDPNTSAYGDRDRIIGSFREIIKNNPGKEVIVYCYSMPCMTGRKIGKMLAENDIYVKHLGIGWNEWRYYWDLWNHDSEAPTDVSDYVVSGENPGVPKIEELPAPCGEGEFGC